MTTLDKLKAAFEFNEAELERVKAQRDNLLDNLKFGAKHDGLSRNACITIIANVEQEKHK